MSTIDAILSMKKDDYFIRVSPRTVIEDCSIYKNHEYIIAFYDLGHRCGYINVKNNNLNIDDIECHGGVTFNDCRLPFMKRAFDNEYWIGFDCAHYGDLRSFTMVKKYFDVDNQIYPAFMNLLTFSSDSKLWTFDDVENECKKIIDQVYVRIVK